jgi:hypothetical protein
MMKRLFIIGTLIISAMACTESRRHEVYMKQKDQSVWVSFENRTGEKGAAGQSNQGAKGHPSDQILAGDSCELLNIRGAGIIQRIWMTVNDRSPEMLRGLWLKMYWDDAPEPAVSAPLGDFFCNGLSVMTAFENCYFSNPEGRSLNCIVPMPFKTAARIVLVNLSEKRLHSLFYDINLVRLQKWDNDMMYFHSLWNRENPTTLGQDYTILPEIKGEGRFLGVSMGIVSDSIYRNTWWGEGEVKVYLDGDEEFPTLCGTGAEDYIGTGWGQGRYAHKYQGCLLSGRNRQWSFYRFHVPDPVLFSNSCRVTLQQIGGSEHAEVLELWQNNIPLIPISVFRYDEERLIGLFDEPMPLDDPAFPKGWVNFYRQDDVSSVAYYYLDRP